MSKPIFIGEVKTSSPFGYYGREFGWTERYKMAEEHADWISIHTDKRWDGSFGLLQWAAMHTNKPVLAKGFHDSNELIEKAIRHGASFVLTVGFIPAPSLLPYCLLEPLSINQLKGYPKNCRVVWNSRNLEDGSLKTETWEQARAAFGGWMCQASNIKTMNDVKPDADAILVGRSLQRFIKSFTA